MRADFPEPLKSLYPPLEPFHAAMLDVGDGHKIYIEQSGNPNGLPVVFLHGGPGGGTAPVQRRFFNPKRYHIILFDQRGCGKSTPHASLENNTTWHLVNDMEKIRRALAIKEWVVFGGSWGSTLALLYAQTHPERVAALILRGIFLMQQRELDWFYGGGTGALFPEAYDKFLAPLPEYERDDPLPHYYRRLTEPSLEAERLTLAKAWSLWEGSTVTLTPDHAQQSHAVDAHFALAFARIEAHYFHHKGFLERDDQILADCDRIAHLPCSIVQGRYDAICPPRSAWELKKRLPNADLHIVKVAGHSAFEAEIQHALIDAADRIADNRA